jgi:hypothetical protein
VAVACGPSANGFFPAGIVLFEVPTGVAAALRGRRLSYLRIAAAPPAACTHWCQGQNSPIMRNVNLPWARRLAWPPDRADREMGESAVPLC